MDSNTANVIEKSVDKFYYLGLTFGALFAGKLALDAVTAFGIGSNSKTNSSRPMSGDTGSSERNRRRKKRSSSPSILKKSPKVQKKESKVSFNLKDVNKGKKPESLEIKSHNLKDDSKQDFNFPPNAKESKYSPGKSKLRKGSIVENISGQDTTIIKICFTGGPCAGKTTAISSVANMLRDKGYEAMCTPEAATLIFSSGGILNMETYSMYEGLLFQKALMGLQITLEKQFVDIISIKPIGKYAFVLCDRGLMDGSAYIEDKVFDGLLEESGLDRSDCLNTYDIVIHMVTAAKGAKEYYTLENNQARDEDCEDAIQLDAKLQKAWSMHPNFFYNDNQVENFAEKVSRAENFILKKLGMPVGTEFHRKFTIRNPGGKLFAYLVKVFNCIEIELTDIIFKNTDSKDKEEDESKKTIYYIRKRVSHPQTSLYSSSLESRKQKYLYQGKQKI